MVSSPFGVLAAAGLRRRLRRKWRGCQPSFCAGEGGYAMGCYPTMELRKPPQWMPRWAQAPRVDADCTCGESVASAARCQGWVESIFAAAALEQADGVRATCCRCLRDSDTVGRRSAHRLVIKPVKHQPPAATNRCQPAYSWSCAACCWWPSYGWFRPSCRCHGSYWNWGMGPRWNCLDCSPPAPMRPAW